MFQKNHLKLHQTISTFYSKKYFNLIKKKLFLVKKLEIPVIIFMIMLIRSSERIFNPSRYTGIFGVNVTLDKIFYISIFLEIQIK